MSNQLFIVSLADIFSVYPKIFRELISAEEEKRKAEGKLAKDVVYLPSDSDWLEKVYYRLLEVQKKVNEALETGMTLDEITKKSDKPIWDPSYILEKFSASSTPNGRIFGDRKRCVPDQPIEFIDVNILGCWSLKNISKAAKLLRKPPLRVIFDDEHEMRKVYSLIYDVFRYKVVLSQALSDVSFYAYYPELKIHQNRVWLMLFELYTRHFVRRHSEDIEKQNTLYKDADVDVISNCLWKLRIPLAASISRLRIKNGALHLSQLLPVHLQNEKVAIAAANPIVTGWINPFKLGQKELATEYLETMGLSEVQQGDETSEKPLLPNQYKWDTVCPLFMSCLPLDRGGFAKSKFVQDNLFVMQDRTFSIAPAVVSRLLEHYELDGDIIQTHVSSPRSTAYLASLLRSVNRLNYFVAYGAGSNLEEYRAYMKLLGVDNVRLVAEKFTSIPLESSRMDGVVGIFATPPNSFSAISDPIDLICSRGGDLSMLEVLTESEISDDGKKRVAEILEVQRETLRLAMSRPQIQFVLYLTHSIVGSENQDMIERAIDNINRNAFDKHLLAYKEKKRLEALAEAEVANIPQAALSASSPRKRGADDSSAKSRQGKESRKNSLETAETVTLDADGNEDYSKVIKVPQTDQFELADLPDVCLNQDRCLYLDMTGCYIALLQRKQITRLNAKYLIKMAEGRGLFGKGDRNKSAKQKATKKNEKKIDKVKKSDSIAPKSTRTKKGDIDTLIQRLNTPTHSSFIRSNLQKVSSVSDSLSFNFSNRDCSRHNKLHTDDTMPEKVFESTRAKKWWRDATKYINQIQDVQGHEGSTIIPKEITKMVRAAHLPPLSLSRAEVEFEVLRPNKLMKIRVKERTPYPVTINHLEFNSFGNKSRTNLSSSLADDGYWTV